MLFWDNVGVSGLSIVTNCVRVTGPNGFNQIASFYGAPLTHNGVNISATFYVTSPNGLWNGTHNGLYSVSIEPNTVQDVNGNFMSSDIIGTFAVATETKPVISLGSDAIAVMNQPASFRLTALSSFPYRKPPFSGGPERQRHPGVPGWIAHRSLCRGRRWQRIATQDGIPESAHSACHHPRCSERALHSHPRQCVSLHPRGANPLNDYAIVQWQPASLIRFYRVSSAP